MSFAVNSFCRAEIDGNKNICGEPFTEDINELYCEDKYISFKCKKCGKLQNLLISCKYGPDKKDEKLDINYSINFELLSPLALLQQDWLKNYIEIDPYYISENYLQCYLSAIFYFYGQNLPSNFLIPDFVLKAQLEEEKNNYYSIVNDEEFFDENKIKKVVVKNKEKEDSYDNNIIIFEEDDESRRESLTFEINDKKDGLLNSSDKLIQLRDSLNKRELKSSFKKKKDDFGGIEKKKTVEFKLNLKKLNLNGDS